MWTVYVTFEAAPRKKSTRNVQEDVPSWNEQRVTRKARISIREVFTESHQHRIQSLIHAEDDVHSL
jgi:hypothetical protein